LRIGPAFESLRGSDKKREDGRGKRAIDGRRKMEDGSKRRKREDVAQPPSAVSPPEMFSRSAPNAPRSALSAAGWSSYEKSASQHKSVYFVLKTKQTK
jgi:hypothetical protein